MINAPGDIGGSGPAASELPSDESSRSPALLRQTASGEPSEEGLGADIAQALLDFVQHQIRETRMQMVDPLVEKIGAARRQEIDDKFLNEVLDTIENAFEEFPR